MFKATRILLATIFFASLFASPAAPAQSTGGKTIVCESTDGDYHRCDVNTEGSVQLVRRLSWVSCEQGTSWGYDPRGIWVDQGCRAEFRYGKSTTAAKATGRSLICESRNGQYQYCQAPTQGSAQLRRRLSSAACVEGDSWGYDTGGIWVSDNCRAEFAFGRDASATSAGGGTKDDWKPAGRLTCESLGGAYKLCKANTQGKVRVAKQLSQDGCVEGQTWGRDASGIWVTGGCRAQFDYGVAKVATAAAGAATATATATTVNCESVGDQGKRCKIGDTSKVTVTLQKQLSRSECIKDDTWGVDEHSLWVTGGCRATFTVTPIASASTTTANAGNGDSWNQPSGGTSLNSAVGGNVPAWMIGTFNGYNPLYDAGMQLTVGEDGKVVASVGGTRLTGWYSEGKLVVGGVDYTVRRDQNGFRTIQDNDPGNQVVYTRVR